MTRRLHIGWMVELFPEITVCGEDDKFPNGEEFAVPDDIYDRAIAARDAWQEMKDELYLRYFKHTEQFDIDDDTWADLEHRAKEKGYL